MVARPNRLQSGRRKDMLFHQLRQARRPAAVTIEFPIVFFVLVLFMFAIFEYGHFIMLRHLVNNAVRAGARQAAVDCSFSQVGNSNPPKFQADNPGLQTQDIQNTVFAQLASQTLNNASGKPLQASDVQVFLVDANGNPIANSVFNQAQFGQGVAVQLDVRYQPILPGFGFLVDSTPINVICIMRSEANY
jgi:Flp pilus assembly protein TadG